MGEFYPSGHIPQLVHSCWSSPVQTWKDSNLSVLMKMQGISQRGRWGHFVSSSSLFCSLFSPLSDENKEYFLALQQMIEEMAEKAGGPVVLIAHSMGNMYTLYFLNQQPQAWKDRYIKAFVSLGPPWAGVAKTLRVLTSGKRRNRTLKLCVRQELLSPCLPGKVQNEKKKEESTICTLTLEKDFS